MTTKKLALGLLVGSICMLTSHVVWADFIEQEIKNRTIGIPPTIYAVSLRTLPRLTL